jgi:membrane protease YdiL (CAAX protease family)
LPPVEFREVHGVSLRSVWRKRTLLPLAESFRMSWHDNDPLFKHRHALVGALLAVVVSVLLAAFIAGSLPFDYGGRAWTYAALVVWILVGAVMVLRATLAGERKPLTPARVLKWIAAIWLWPGFVRRK